jgi:protein-disulfide isomerase
MDDRDAGSDRTRLTRRDLIAGAIGAGGAGLAGWLLPPTPSRVRAFLTDDPAFLADNPDLIATAAAVADTRAGASEAGRRRDMIEAARGGLLNPLAAPCLGPMQGRLGLIEITDYLCAPCRGSSRAVESALAEHPGSNAALLLVPISGALSDYMAGFAAAAYFARPAGFATLHRGLMEGPAPRQNRMEEIAASLGYDVAAVAGEADSPRIRAYLAASRRFAETLGLSGVPAFLNPQGNMHLGGITARQAASLIGRADQSSGT